MKELSAAISDGAMAFKKRVCLSCFFIVIVFALLQAINWQTSVAFVIGLFFYFSRLF